MREFLNCRNPVLPVQYHIPDGEAHVMPDGRVYVYGSWDENEGDAMFCSDRYYVVSSKNMRDWTDHGLSFHSSWVPWTYDDNAPVYPEYSSLPRTFQPKAMEAPEGNDPPKGPKLDGPPLMFKTTLNAPDCIHKDGKYYMYFSMTDDREGVAVSDRPEGPFLDPVMLHCHGIDPAVFVDDDGQAYYYWGQFEARGAKLKDSMLELDESTITPRLATEAEHFFHEGASLRKRGDTYYFVYAGMERGKPSCISYATSKSPLGPFEYRGIIIDNDGCDPADWNIHGSIEEVNGQWYVFYHRTSRNVVGKRRLCIEPIFFSEDGSIPEVKMTSQGAGLPFGPGDTMCCYHHCGGTGTAYLDRYLAPAARQFDADGDEILTAIGEGDTICYRYFETAQELHTLQCEALGSGTIRLYAGDTEVGHAVIEDGNQTASVCALLPGRHTLTLEFTDCQALQFHRFSIAP